MKELTVLSSGRNLSAGNAYRLFIRGSRSTEMYQADNNPTATNTILRTAGTLFTGTYTPVLSPVKNNYTFVGNPYASPVDFSKIFAGATNISSSYYVWDPALGQRGAYVVYNAVYDTTNNKSSAVNKNIQSGQAFLVQTVGTAPFMKMQESYKSLGNTSVFRDPSHKTKLSVQLLSNLSGRLENVADGAVVFFGNDFSNEIANDDSYKLTNLDENLAINQKETLLSIEGLPLVTANDTIQLKIWQLTAKNYYLRLAGSNFSPDVTAYLKDQYLHTSVAVDLSSAASIPFSTDSAVSASYADNRFSIIFKTANTLPVNLTDIKASQNNKNILVEWNAEEEMDVYKYEVEISANGNEFTKAATVAVKQNTLTINHYSWLDLNADYGDHFYRIKVIEKSGTVRYSKTASVHIGGNEQIVTIFPNPIKNNTINAEFINMEKGRYLMSLYNNIGQKLQADRIEHIGGSANYTILIKKSISRGAYTLQVTKGEKITNVKVIVE